MRVWKSSALTHPPVVPLKRLLLRPSPFLKPISIRNFLLPHLIANPDEVPKFFSEDYAGDADLVRRASLPSLLHLLTTSLSQRHISYLSHRALGDMLALYMREMTCETKRRLVSGHPEIRLRPLLNLS